MKIKFKKTIHAGIETFVQIQPERVHVSLGETFEVSDQCGSALIAKYPASFEVVVVKQRKKSEEKSEEKVEKKVEPEFDKQMTEYKDK